MFNKIRDKSFNEGTDWAMDTFAWTVETILLQGKSLEEAYQTAKDIYVNKKNLNNRLNAWKELNV
jgi:hypothetical protein